MKRYRRIAVSLALVLTVMAGSWTVAAARPSGFNDEGWMPLVTEPEGSEQSVIFCRGDKDLTMSDIPWVDSEQGKAVRLNGKDEYFRMPAESLKLTDFTLSLWVNWDGAVTESGEKTLPNQRIFAAIGQPRKQNSITLSPNESAGGGDGVLQYTQMAAKGTATLTQKQNKPLVSQKWQHIVVVSKENTLSLYLNELLMDEATATASMADMKINQLLLGRGVAIGGDGYFSGLMDNVLLYNRALTIDEIRDINRVQNPTATTTTTTTTTTATTTVPNVALTGNGALSPIPPVVWIVSGVVLLLVVVLTVAVNRQIDKPEKTPPPAEIPKE